MGKGKMSLVDVRAMVKELRASLLGSRVANIYNLSAKSFIFKMSSSDSKHLLLIESGIRIHLTKYQREHDKLPSNFAAKLRKHLRLRRVESISQIGYDRIIDMQFGHGEQAYHLILEFYAQGNVILTDSKYRIIMLLRVHTYANASGVVTIGAGAVMADGDAPSAEKVDDVADDEKESAAATATSASSSSAAAPSAAGDADRVAVHEVYPLNQAQHGLGSDSISESIVRACLERQVRKEADELAAFQNALQQHERDVREAESKAQTEESVAGAQNKQGKAQNAKEEARIAAQRKQRQVDDIAKKLQKPKMKKGIPLSAILAQDIHFGTEIIDHCLMKAGIDPNVTLQQFLATQGASSSVASAVPTASSAAATPLVPSSSQLTALVASLSDAPLLLERISRDPMPGYIFYKNDTSSAEEKQPANTQQQKQQAEKKKKQREATKGADAKKGELVVDEIDGKSALPPAETEEKTDVEQAPAAGSSATEPAASSSSSSSVAPKAAESITVYIEYLPILLSAHTSRPEYKSLPAPLQFPSFSDAMDEFYSKAEEQREQLRLVKEKQQALLKLEREKQRQQAQLAALEAQQELSTLKASLIESNLDAVNACLGSINTEIAKGIDWRELTRVIKEEKVHGKNPIAKMIHSLKLLENQITITLSEGLKHLLPEYAKDKSVKVYQVELDLSLTAFANAQLYYDVRRKHGEKQKRAESASLLAIKAAERKTNTALNAVDIKARIQKVRKVFWFEKFHFFISSENYLVIGGKDAAQNELLVKKYFTQNDIYVHAEVHGASSVIIKNPTAAPVPPLTLSQAGCMTIARSSAWKNKLTAGVEAYWVTRDQVSKTPPTGMSLPTGSFMIRGRKNFLPRAPMNFGIALLFRVDDESAKRHIGERRVRTAMEQAEAESKEDKYDQVADLPDASAGASKEKGSSSSKKKKPAGSTGGSNKKKLSESSGDFDVTSNLHVSASSSAALAAAIGQLTSEDEAGDAESEAKQARLNKLKGGDAEAESAAAPAAGRKKMSTAERKRLKKAKEGGAAGPASADKPVATTADSSAVADADAGSDDDDDDASKKGKKPASKTNPGNKPLPRGKRNKLKRAAARYANQDEEDLVLAAELLGLQGVDKKKKEVAEREKKFHARKDAEEESEESEEEEEEEKPKSKSKDSKKTPAESASSPPLAAAPAAASSSPAAVSPSSLPVDDEEKKQFRKQQKEARLAERAEVDALKAEEGIMDDDTNAAVDPTATLNQELSVLTGKPVAEDALQFILPVCAPYDALMDYKYKLKIVPGVAKKGKAAKSVVTAFMNSSQVTHEEKELMKILPEQDLINVLLSNLKVVMPGGSGGGEKGKPGKRRQGKPAAKKGE